jgi:hypothetical protein
MFGSHGSPGNIVVVTRCVSAPEPPIASIEDSGGDNFPDVLSGPFPKFVGRW